jgi:hypothetical protein
MTAAPPFASFVLPVTGSNECGAKEEVDRRDASGNRCINPFQETAFRRLKLPTGSVSSPAISVRHGRFFSPLPAAEILPNDATGAFGNAVIISMLSAPFPGHGLLPFFCTGFH